MDKYNCVLGLILKIDFTVHALEESHTLHRYLPLLLRGGLAVYSGVSCCGVFVPGNGAVEHVAFRFYFPVFPVALHGYLYAHSC